MSTSITAQALLAGSVAYDADVQQIKSVVNMLRRLIADWFESEDHARPPREQEFETWLVGTPSEPVEGTAYAIGFLCNEGSRICNRSVTAMFKHVETSTSADGRQESMHVKHAFNRITWSAKEGAVPRREHVVQIAAALDRLILETIEFFPAIRKDVVFYTTLGSLPPQD